MILTNNLTYSIFYNQNEWFKLLEYIKLCVKKYDETMFFFIKLSYERGAHLRLTIRADESIKIKTAYYFSEQIESFINKRRSSNIDIKTIHHKLFKDFSNNTIYYGIHDYDIFNLLNDDQTLNYYNQITIIILSIYDEYKSDTIESLTEIMIQVYAVASLASNKTIDDLIIMFEGLLKIESRKFDKQSLINQQKVNSENFNNNRKFIIEYLKEILIDKTNSTFAGWEKNIYDLVTSSLIKNIDKEVIIDISENINYNSIAAQDMFLRGLKELNNQTII